ncbi:MAG: thioesterase family protein [bacterium]|nr:thioesterase family protein [bacterium]
MIINKLKLRVSYADTDKMSVVYYARYFEYFEKGRNELLREIGLPYVEMEKKDLKLPVIESHCEYKKGIKYDELIVIKTCLIEPPYSKLRIDYEIFDETETEVRARGYTVHSFVNQYGKAIRPPKDFAEIITKRIVG